MYQNFKINSVNVILNYKEYQEAEDFARNNLFGIWKTKNLILKTFIYNIPDINSFYNMYYNQSHLFFVENVLDCTNLTGFLYIKEKNQHFYYYTRIEIAGISVLFH